jgi:hypothetical protein
MEKEFIPYEQALALKELGFDEPCLLSIIKGTNLHLGGYDCDIKYEFPITKQELFIGYNKGGGKPFLNPLYEINIPTWQQAFRWFREKHGIFSSIWCFETEQKFFIEFGFGIHKFEVVNKEELECLKKLIEIVKDRLNG